MIRTTARRTARTSLLAATLALLAAAPAWAEMRMVESKNDFATTLDKLRGAIEASPASVIFEVDHAAGAMKAGMELEPTTLVVFGNPAAGTQLMNADRTAGLSLPMKMLVMEKDGAVSLAYDDPKGLSAMHDLGEASGVTEKMSGLVGKLAEAAAN